MNVLTSGFKNKSQVEHKAKGAKSVYNNKE